MIFILSINSIQSSGIKQQSQETLGLSSLFKKSYMAKISIVMFTNWLTANMCYYGLSFSSVNLVGDIYVNFVLSAVIEIPSYIFVVLV